MIALSLAIGLILIEGGKQQDASKRAPDSAEEVVATVNGDSISRSELDRVYEKLLQVYKRAYLQSGRDVDEALSGPQGAYYKLQIEYLAAQQLIEQEIIRQEAESRGLSLAESEVLQAFEKRYEEFLRQNGMDEKGFRKLFQDARAKRLTRILLGIDKESVDDFKSGMRQEVKDDLLKLRLAQSILEEDVSASSEEGKQRLNAWLDERKANGELVYRDPLLRAYDLETQLNAAETDQLRRHLLEKTVAAYEEARAQPRAEAMHIDYFLTHLYNMRVQLDMKAKEELKKSAQGKQTEKELQNLNQDISRSRENATSLFLSATSGQTAYNVEQLKRMLMLDPENYFYYYLYAQAIMDQEPGEQGMALRMIKRALDLAPDYVDAHVLLGDFNVQREFYSQAVENYQDGLSLLQNRDSVDVGKLKTLNSDASRVRRKLAEAYIQLAEQQSDNPEKQAHTLTQADKLLNTLLDSLDQEDPDYGRVLADQGDAAMLKEDYRAARERYQESLAHRNDVSVQVKLGRAYIRGGQLVDGIRTFQTALKRDPHFAKAHLGLADAYRAQGKVMEALQEYKQAFKQGADLDYPERRKIALDALEIKPDDVEMRLQLGDYYLERHVYSGAVNQYRAVLEFDPDSVPAYRGLGRVAMDELNYKKALEHFDQALANSSSPKEKIELYRLILETEQKIVGPGNALNKAGQEAMYQLAILYQKTGQYAASLEMLSSLTERYSGYRPQDVKRLAQQVKVAAKGNLPGDPVKGQGHQIIAPGESHEPYNSTPPTSGSHYALPARWGIHEDPIDDEIQLRNLAGGGVLIQYQPDLREETIEQVRDLVLNLRQDEPYCRLLLAPYPGLDSAIALTAWTRIEKLESFDRQRITQFVDAFIDKGPETGEVSCSLERP